MSMEKFCHFKESYLNEQLEINEKNLMRKRYLLHTRKQVEGEYFEDYYKDLQCLFKLCKFRDDSILRDHVVFGIKDCGIREQLLGYDNPSLESVVETCRSGENKSFARGDYVKIETELQRLPADDVEVERTSVVFKDEDSLQDVEGHDYISSTFMEISGEQSANPNPHVCEASAELDGKSDVHQIQMVTGRVPCASLNTATGAQQESTSKLEPRNKCSRIKKEIKAKSKIIVMCNICNKSLASEQDLHSHMLSHNQSDETRLLPHPSQMIRLKKLNDAALRKQCHKDVCNVDDNTFASSKDLSVHMLGHTSVNPLEPSPLPNKHLVISTDNTTIKCDLCVRTFSGKIATRRLNYHKLNAHYTYICDHCNVQFLNRVALLSHIKKIFGVKLYTCKYCSKKFNRTYFNSHLRRVHGISSKKKQKPAQWCDICGSCFHNSANLLKHRKTHLQEEHSCNICGKVFPTKPDLDRHVEYHGKFPCYFCDQVFETRRDFTTHMRLTTCKVSSKAHIGSTHSGKGYSCDICQTIVSTRAILKAHVDHAHSGVRYTCDICNKIASTKAALRTHMERSHSGVTYTCDICQKSVSSRTALKSHMHLHSGERLECGICQKSISSKQYLEIHMRNVHAEEKQFQCHFCSKTYAYRNSLNLHLLSHTKERPFRCDICNKNYLSKDYLKIHLRTHTGETPHYCHQCGKGFSVKSNLNRHLTSHNTVIKYDCNVCHKSFLALHSLNIHMRYHTEIYKCHVCMKVFTFKHELRKHALTHEN